MVRETFNFQPIIVPAIFHPGSNRYFFFFFFFFLPRETFNCGRRLNRVVIPGTLQPAPLPLHSRLTTDEKEVNSITNSRRSIIFPLSLRRGEIISTWRRRRRRRWRRKRKKENRSGDSDVFKLVWDRDRERKRRVTGNNYPPSFFSPSVRNDSWSKERREEGTHKLKRGVEFFALVRILVCVYVCLWKSLLKEVLGILLF